MMKPVKGLKNTRKTSATGADKPEKKKSAGNGNGTRTVTIEARIDVGFGNAIYVRGEGEGLSWTCGLPMTCVDSSTWQWSGPASDQVKFKLLLNDAVWATGDDLIARPGEKVQVLPAF
jgi:hypothetical protein